RGRHSIAHSSSISRISRKESGPTGPSGNAPLEHAISMTVPGADAPGAAEREVLLVLAAEEGDDLIHLLGREATHDRHPTLASHEDVAAIEARSRSTPRTPHRRSPSTRAPRGRGRRG